jgi:ubiquinone/menaquinone biosynthesis C-methylase UbiE
MAAELPSAYPDLRVTVTDFDDTMVDAAARRLHPFGDRAVAGHADAEALPLEAEKFDVGSDGGDQGGRDVRGRGSER